MASFIAGTKMYGASPRTTAMTFMTLGLGQMLFARSIRSAEPIWRSHVHRNRALDATCIGGIAMTFASLYIPGLNQSLKLEAPDWRGQTTAIGAAIVPWLAIEILKNQRLLKEQSQ